MSWILSGLFLRQSATYAVRNWQMTSAVGFSSAKMATEVLNVPKTQVC